MMSLFAVSEIGEEPFTGADNIPSSSEITSQSKPS